MAVPGGPSPRAVQFDVTDEGAVRSAVEIVVEEVGAIDVLVNNAGIAPVGPVETSTDDDWRRVFEVNLLGAVRVTRAVLPSMRAAGSGVIVNVSSINGRFAVPFMAAYSASKFGLEAMSEALQYEVEEHGIRVLVVEPPLHVSRAAFEVSLDAARRAGFREVERPRLRGRHTTLLA